MRASCWAWSWRCRGCCGIARYRFAERWRQLIVAGATCVLVLAPWTIRNLRTFEEFVPLSTNGNELIVYANCDEVYNGRLIGFWSFDCQERYRNRVRRPGGRRIEEAAFWREVGVDYARDHIGEVPKIVAIRVLRQWELFRPWQTIDFSTIENRDKDSAALGLGMYYVLAAGAIAGTVMLRRRGVPLLPLGAQVISVTLTAAYAYGTVRFRAPVEPVLCILAGVAAVPLLTRAWRWAMPPDVPVDADPASRIRRRSCSADPAACAAAPGRPRQLARDRHRRSRGGDPAAGPVRDHRRHDGRGLHALLPGADVGGRRAERRLPALYGPGALHVLMGWYQVFGFTLGAERTFGLLQHLGIIFGLYVLARAWGRTAATAVATLSTLLVLTPIGLTAMAWNGGLALTLWSAVFGVRAVHLLSPTRASQRVDHLRRAGRAGADLPTGSRHRRRAGDGVAAVAPPSRADGRCSSGRSSGRSRCGCTWRSPARARRSRGCSSTRCSTCAAGASCHGRRAGTVSTARCRRSPSRFHRGGGCRPSPRAPRCSCGSGRCW